MSAQATDPLESYARTRDADYPPATQYADVMGTLAEPLRGAVLTLYTVLHKADDLADDPTCSPDERLQALEHYAAEFERVVGEGRTPREPEHAELFVRCRELLEGRASTSTAPFAAVFAVLAEMTRWPAAPHFRSRLEVQAFNYRKFAAIVEVFAPHLLADAEPEQRPLLQAMFVEHMLGMHVVNVLMDLDEDRAAGQFWFARDDYDEAQWPTAEARASLLEEGHGHMRRAPPLCDAQIVGEQSARFFSGLRGIYEALAGHLAASAPAVAVAPVGDERAAHSAS